MGMRIGLEWMHRADLRVRATLLQALGARFVPTTTARRASPETQCVDSASAKRGGETAQREHPVHTADAKRAPLKAGNFLNIDALDVSPW